MHNGPRWSMQLNDAPVAIATHRNPCLKSVGLGRPVGKESPIPALPNRWPLHLKLTARYRIYAYLAVHAL